MKELDLRTIVIGLLIAVGIALLLICVLRKNPASDTSFDAAASSSSLNTQKDSNDFIITNHLTRPIKIVSYQLSPKDPSHDLPEVVVERLNAKSKTGISMKQVIKHFRHHRGFRIYLLSHEDPDFICHYSDYNLDVCKDETIKSLHIGMVTSRWVGASHDDQWKPAANAVQGRPFVRLHNRTHAPIRLNENILIPALSTVKYHGRDALGVRLGTIFEDQDRIHQSFHMRRPATDIYFGVTSDLLQPLFGGWQIDPEFDDSADEPYYLLEAGWMGGPADGSIPIGYLPRLGKNAEQYHGLDEWGVPVDSK